MAWGDNALQAISGAPPPPAGGGTDTPAPQWGDSALQALSTVRDMSRPQPQKVGDISPTPDKPFIPMGFGGQQGGARGPALGQSSIPPKMSTFLDTYVTTPARRAFSDLVGAPGSASNAGSPLSDAAKVMLTGNALAPFQNNMPRNILPTADDVRGIVGAGQDAPTPMGRTIQTGIEGGMAAAGAGAGGAVPMAMGALSGGASQGAKEMGLPPIVQQAAGFLPVVLGGGMMVGKMGARSMGLVNPETVVQQKVMGALSADGFTPQQIAAKYADWQAQGAKPEALVDLGGDATRRLARSLYTAGGPAASTVESNLGNRGDLRPDRILRDFNDTARNGAPAANIYDASGELQQQRQAAADPLYKQAFAANQNIEDPVINRLMQTPAMKLAASEALTRMQNQMQLVSAPDPELTAAYNEAVKLGKIPEGQGTGVGVGKGLKLRYLDYIKQSLDGIINRAGGFNPDPAVNPEKVGSLQDLKDIRSQFVKALDANDVTAKAGPNSIKPNGGLYAQARAAYSGPSQSLNALDMGRGFLKEDPEVIGAQIAKLSPGDQDFYRIGAARALQDQMGGAGGANTIIKPYSNIPRNTNIAARIQAVFGDQFTYDRFAKLAAREANMARSENAMGFRDTQSTNKAADLGEPNKAVEIAKDIGTTGMDMVGTQSIMYPLIKLGGKWLIQAAQRAKGVTPEVASRLAPILTDPKADITGFLEQLAKANGKRGPGFLQNYLLPSTIRQGLLSAPDR